MKLPQVGLQYWIKVCSSEFKLCAVVHQQKFTNCCRNSVVPHNYEGHLESKERFAIKKHLLIIGKKKNMQVLSHTFTHFST
jgi:hypothetical protein